MKTTNRIPKAIVVVVVVGLGLVHNMNNKSFSSPTFMMASQECNLDSAESDTLKSSEKNLFVYTKSILKTSIQQLISNL